MEIIQYQHLFVYLFIYLFINLLIWYITPIQFLSASMVFGKSLSPDKTSTSEPLSPEAFS